MAKKYIWSFPVRIQIEVDSGDYLQANTIFDKFTDHTIDQLVVEFDRSQAVLITVDMESQQAAYRLPTAHELKLLNNLTLNPELAAIANRSVDRMDVAEQAAGGQAEISSTEVEAADAHITARQRAAELDVLIGELKQDASKCVGDSCPYMASRMKMNQGAKVAGKIPTCHVCGLKVNHDIYHEGES